jgi:hypothetical protein
LQIHRKNLASLEVKKAQFGIDVPLHILNEMEEEEREIARLEEQSAKSERRK